MDLELRNQSRSPGRASRIASVTLVLSAALLTIATASGHDFAVDDRLLLALRRADDLQTPIGPHWLVNLFENITSLGSSAVTALVTILAGVVAIGTRRYRNALYAVLNFAGAEVLSNGIKALIVRPRPQVVPHLVEAGGFSFPSGHSTLSAATYLGIGLIIASCQQQGSRQALVLVVAAVPIALVGLSRLFLGVHFPTDVAGGWLIGAAWAISLWIAFFGTKRGGGTAPR